MKKFLLLLLVSGCASTTPPPPPSNVPPPITVAPTPTPLPVVPQPEVWFAPGDDVPDFPLLYQERTATTFGYQDWSSGLSRTQVLQISNAWFNLNKGNVVSKKGVCSLTAQGQTLIDFLAQKHLKLAIRFAVFSPDNVQDLAPGLVCDYSVEGIDTEAAIQRSFKCVSQALGGALDYIKDDEPLSHASDVQKACNAAPSVVAASVARNNALAIQAFPNAKIIESEPPGALAGRGQIGKAADEVVGSGVAELVDYLTYLKKYSTEQNVQMPSAIRFDVDWYNDKNHDFKWRDATTGLPAFITAIKTFDLPYSMIFNTNGPDLNPLIKCTIPVTSKQTQCYFNLMGLNPKTDGTQAIAADMADIASADWVASALSNAAGFTALVKALNLPAPRDYVAQSWNELPELTLPENAPNNTTRASFLKALLDQTTF